MAVALSNRADDRYLSRSPHRTGLCGMLFLTLWSVLASPAPGQTQETATAAAATARIEQDLRVQNLPAAMHEYQALVASNAQNSQAWTGYGVLLYGSGQAAAAKDALSKAIALDPASSRAELFLALSQADLGACDQAAPMLERHFHSETQGKLQRLAGLTLLQCSTKAPGATDNPSAALQVAAELRSAYPGDPDVLYASAELYTRLWTSTAEELIAKHPDSYRVHQLAAEVNDAQGNLDQAIREYRAALEQSPRLPQMHYRIGQLLLRAGAPDADQKATLEFRAELSIDSQSAVSALALAGIERHEGKLAEAEADYRLAARLDPELVDARIGLAQALLAQHKVNAAQEEVKGLLASHPNEAQAHYVLMLSYREQGKLSEAAGEMAAFQELQHDHEDQFRKKLTALLTGSKDAPPTGGGIHP